TCYGVNGTDIQPIMVPVGNIPPQATDVVTTKSNLDANAAVIHTNGGTEVPGSITLTPSSGGAAAAHAYTINADGDVVFNTTVMTDGVTYTLGTFSYTHSDTNPPAVSAANLPAAGTDHTAYTPAVVGHPFNPNDAA